MADDLRRLARELGVTTARLRSKLGSGWVAEGDDLDGFNVTIGPVYLDSVDAPKVGVQVTTVYSCTEPDDPVSDIVVGRPSEGSPLDRQPWVLYRDSEGASTQHRLGDESIVEWLSVVIRRVVAARDSDLFATRHVPTSE